MTRIRLDQYLVEHQLAPTRARAQALILAGKVRVNGVPATKAGQAVPADARVELIGEEHPYVGRGGIKLAHALVHFAIDPAGKICLDAGASTGGFTDCLLQRGARKIYAVDVGYGQLAWVLRQDPRVVVIERTNLRTLDAATIPEPVDLVTLDLSFIGLAKVFPAVARLLGAGGIVVALVKPQFEVGRAHVGKGGIVRDPQARADAVAAVIAAAQSHHWHADPPTESPIHGADGNVEYLACFRSEDAASVVENLSSRAP